MSRDWTKAFFRAEVFTPGSPEAVAAAADEVRFLWKVLSLKKGSRVLDVACGTGRHATRLARRGASVLGVDVTPEYLREARRASRGLKNASFVRADMRRLSFRGEFDAAVNLWTSFGYFERPSDDLEALRGIARALKSGGLFLIDMLDFEAAKRRGQTRHWMTRADGAYVLEEALFLGGWDPKIVNEWTILRRGRPARRSRFVVRGYGRTRMSAALRKAGLEPLKTWSSMSPEGLSGTRLVVLARKS